MIDDINKLTSLEGVSVQGNKIIITPNKPCRLRVNRRGDGYITNYTLSVGSSEARRAGFIDEDGQPLDLGKIIDEEAHTITFYIKK